MLCQLQDLQLNELNIIAICYRRSMFSLCLANVSKSNSNKQSGTLLIIIIYRTDASSVIVRNRLFCRHLVVDAAD